MGSINKLHVTIRLPITVFLLILAVVSCSQMNFFAWETYSVIKFMFSSEDVCSFRATRLFVFWGFYSILICAISCFAVYGWRWYLNCRLTCTTGRFKTFWAFFNYVQCYANLWRKQEHGFINWDSLTLKKKLYLKCVGVVVTDIHDLIKLPLNDFFGVTVFSPT